MTSAPGPLAGPLAVGYRTGILHPPAHGRRPISDAPRPSASAQMCARLAS